MHTKIDTILLLLQEYREKNAIQACFNSSGECSEKIIKAHTIQNSFILDQLENDGHVMMFNYNSKEKLTFKPISRNKATTFTGFCNLHDTKIFNKIDFKNANQIDQISSEQIALFHYRTMCFEYWKKLNIIKIHERIEQATQKEDRTIIEEILPILKTEKNIDWSFFKHPAITGILEGNRLGAQDIYRFFESSKYQIENNKYHLTKGFHLKIDTKIEFALSSFISPVCDFIGNSVNDFEAKKIDHMALNIFPHNNKAHIIFSWHKSSKFKTLEDQINDMTVDQQKVQISKFVLAHSENIVFSPSLTERLTKELNDKIYQIFSGTIIHSSFSLNDFPDVNLFDI